MMVHFLRFNSNLNNKIKSVGKSLQFEFFFQRFINIKPVIYFLHSLSNFFRIKDVHSNTFRNKYLNCFLFLTTLFLNFKFFIGYKIKFFGTGFMLNDNFIAFLKMT